MIFPKEFKGSFIWASGPGANKIQLESIALNVAGVTAQAGHDFELLLKEHPWHFAVSVRWANGASTYGKLESPVRFLITRERIFATRSCI